MLTIAELCGLIDLNAKELSKRLFSAFNLEDVVLSIDSISNNEEKVALVAEKLTPKTTPVSLVT